MKLIDAINRVKRPEPKGPWDNAAPIEEMCGALSIQEMWNYPDALIERMKEYPIFNWLCTDEMVGLYALYLDGQPVGAYYRSGRKMGYNFMWLSQQTAENVRAVLLSYDPGEDFTVIDPDTDLSAFDYYGEVGGTINVEPADG